MVENNSENEHLTESLTNVCIRAKNLFRRFTDSETGDELTVLKDFNLDIEQGEVIALVGPSGCGKSTFLRLVAGLDKPQEGELLYEGKPIEGPAPERGFVFQSVSLYPWLSVEDNISFGLRAQKRYKKEKAKVQEIIDLMGLNGFEKSYPHQISGGMASRCALAQTFIQDPHVILLDEPLSALDAFTRAVIQDEIVKLQKRYNPTIVLVTHDIEEAVYLASRIIVLSPRPCTPIGQVDVDLEHPRNRTSDEFIAKRREVLDLLQFD